MSTFSSYEKIENISMVDQVYSILKEMILSGELAIGDKLPSESKLSNLLGVNRLTVRMAILKLSTAGVLETRTGSGTYVTGFSLENSLENSLEFLYQNNSLVDILNFRYLIEIECCRLLIQKANESELKEFEEIYRSFLNIKSKTLSNLNSVSYNENFQQLLNADIMFHEKIFEMSKNPIFIDIHTIFKPVIKMQLNERMKNAIENNIYEEYDNNFDIYTSIMHRDFRKCEEAYLKFIV